MNWEDCIADYKRYLKLEKSLSDNSVEAYVHDVSKLDTYLATTDQNVQPNQVTIEHLREFVYWLNTLEGDETVGERSQARIVSGIRSFFAFLQMDNRITNDPTELLESPKMPKKLPVFLTIQEVDAIINGIDVSKPEGHRNRAMLETLYSCGLRVSELVNLRVHNLFFNEGFIRVVGKGDKERLVPISGKAMREIMNYAECRCHQDIPEDEQDYLFLNRHGKHLTREMVFLIVQKAARDAGIAKTVSPHTFRHSFATHLVQGGADLRSVQEMLGHESITTTELYTHLDSQHLHDTIIMFHPRK